MFRARDNVVKRRLPFPFATGIDFERALVE
jgi:hypothetical protein